MTAQLSREELQQIADTDHVQCGDAAAMARQLLASMEAPRAEPVAYICRADIDNNERHILARRDYSKACSMPVYAEPPAPAYKAAYEIWQDKTEWVQKDRRFDVLKPWGKHRADVLKEYIEHLEAQLSPAESAGNSPVIPERD